VEVPDITLISFDRPNFVVAFIFRAQISSF